MKDKILDAPFEDDKKPEVKIVKNEFSLLEGDI